MTTKITENGKQLLLVEDDPAFAGVAQAYFREEGYAVVHASDYITAMQCLDKGGLDVIVTDLHFPREKGSEDRTLGKEAISMLREAGPHWYHLPELREGTSEEDRRKYEETVRKVDSCYQTMERTLEESAANQALGIYVAEQAEQLGIPVVIATSGSRHHNAVELWDHFARCHKGWSEIISGPKNVPLFWNLVNRALASYQSEHKK